MRPYQSYLYTSLIVLFMTLLATRPGASQVAESASLSRSYEPVIIEASTIPGLIDQRMEDVHLFARRGGEWESVPLQIDDWEWDDENQKRFFIFRTDGVIDQHDELLFMPGDLGDKAGPESWIPDYPALQSERYELEVTDPNKPGEKAWGYLFISPTVEDTDRDYVSYDPNLDVDDVTTDSYFMGFDLAGDLDELKFREAGGAFGEDMVDREKRRFDGAFFLGPLVVPYHKTEADFQRIETLFKDGTIRVVRFIRKKLLVENLDLPSFVFKSKIYPHHAEFGEGFANVDPDWGVTLIRQSVDMTPAASGMTFHSSRNDPVPIDGNSDNLSSLNVDAGETEWIMATGDQGTMLTFAYIPRFGSSQQLYYRDSAAGGTADGTAETGDGKSYGDAGILIRGNPMEGTETFTTTMFFLPGSRPASFASEMAANLANPFGVAVAAQSYDDRTSPAAVADLSVKWAGKHAIDLEWTAPGDDGNLGMAQSYDIRYSAAEPPAGDLASWFGGATAISNPPAPEMAGTRQTVRVDGLDAGDHYFVMRSTDSSSNTSGFSNVAHGVTTDVPLDSPSATPISFRLQQNYPNPLRLTGAGKSIATRFSFELAEADQIFLAIYDVTGRRVRGIELGKLAPGIHNAYWDGTDARGANVLPGVYVYVLSGQRVYGARRMVVVR